MVQRRTPSPIAFVDAVTSLDHTIKHLNVLVAAETKRLHNQMHRGGANVVAAVLLLIERMMPKEEVNQSQRIDDDGMRKHTSSLVVFDIAVCAIGEQEMEQLFVTEVLLLDEVD
jgi:hypothetical protein